MDVCVCGHVLDQHGGDKKYPGSTACHGMYHEEGMEDAVPCECICYEEDGEEEEEED